MRTDQSGLDVLQYILSDHIGSTSTIVDASGDYVARTGYMPWGSERYTTADIPTDYRYTGQRLEDDLGIYYYNARWYDPSIGRFLQADTIVPDPGNPLAYDRYAYTYNNPIKYIDADGHFALLATAAIGGILSAGVNYAIQAAENYNNGMNFNEAISFSNIDKKELVVSGIGGFVAGATMGLASGAIASIGLVGGLETAATGVVGGAVSNIIAGQAETIASATIDQFTEHTSVTYTPDGRGLWSYSPDFDEFHSDLTSYGFLDSNQIIFDGCVGAFVGVTLTSGNDAITDLGTPGDLFLNRETASWIGPASQLLDGAMEFFQHKVEAK